MKRILPRDWEKIRLSSIVICRSELDQLLSMFSYDMSEFGRYMYSKLGELKRKHG